MIKTTFFVHCDGWVDGGYENIHYHYSVKEAKETIAKWNDDYKQRGVRCWVELLKTEEVTQEEYIEDLCTI